MTEVKTRPTYSGALLRYRVMAYATGIALVTATTLWIVTGAAHENQFKTANGIAWIAHGYLFLIYVVTALHLGIKLRWSFVRIGLVAVAGTIPLMSFVAEHFTMRYVRARESAGRAG